MRSEGPIKQRTTGGQRDPSSAKILAIRSHFLTLTQDQICFANLKIFSRISNFIIEVKVELQKVSWSDRNELIGSTGIVIVSTALLAVFIGIVDIILSRFINILLR